MTAPAPPLPTQGGSYVRLVDGSLVPAGQAPAAPAKPPVKAAKKEA